MKRRPAEIEPDVECAPTFTAIGKGDQWEGSCPCGWWHIGRKAECERAANGHRMPRPVTES